MARDPRFAIRVGRGAGYQGHTQSAQAPMSSREKPRAPRKAPLSQGGLVRVQTDPPGLGPGFSQRKLAVATSDRAAEDRTAEDWVWRVDDDEEDWAGYYDDEATEPRDGDDDGDDDEQVFL